MEAIKGSTLFYGHRAWGSLLKDLFIFTLLIAGYIYLWLYHIAILHYVLFTYHVPILAEYFYWIILFIMFIVLLVKHYRWEYIITTREIVVSYGIIASNVRRYTYDQLQSVDSFQTVGQRLTLWGQLTVTMLISYTGQSKEETAKLDYVHRPKYLANLMLERVNVGQN